ncbi:hypothetical protein [Thermomonospora cellulosilytica]|uniref:Uncharacterized protein n=1 Tax=Thermomonospora cellulosilytica TaxID=1411118 RepID=A0A7W3N3C7_9ACTN|nr:hypothetical protein [Thermomonospora cellulosilytica]MBA9006818.1 hypothetical protein [Thermomonospora cellulosilytica]
MFGLDLGGFLAYSAWLLAVGIMMGLLGGWVLGVLGRSGRHRYRRRQRRR